jgi:hypothetical protein
VTPQAEKLANLLLQTEPPPSKEAIELATAVADRAIEIGQSIDLNDPGRIGRSMADSLEYFEGPQVSVGHTPGHDPRPYFLGFGHARFDGRFGFRGVAHALLSASLERDHLPQYAFLYTLDWASETFLRYWYPVLCSAWNGGRRIHVIQYTLPGFETLLHFPTSRDFLGNPQAT